jgi:hypothetical protein
LPKAEAAVEDGFVSAIHNRSPGIGELKKCDAAGGALSNQEARYESKK